MNGCDTFAYVDGALAQTRAALNPDDPNGTKYMEIVTNAMSMGECYIFPNWNPDKGDLHPEYKKKYQAEVEKGQAVPLLGEDGQPELDENGQPVMIEAEIRTGDVEHIIELTTNVRLQWKRRFRDCDYVFRLEELPIEEIRARYPDEATQVKRASLGGGSDLFDLDGGERKVKKGHGLLVHFYHRKTKMLPKGRYIVFTPDGIVKSEPIPVPHRELPCERMTDDEFAGVLHGRSFISRVRQLIKARGKLTNMILRNIFMCSHPKWMTPAGAVKLDALVGAESIVQFKGPTPPVLAQMNPTPMEVFKFRQDLLDEVSRKAFIGDVARGEPPAGIKAFVALQFLSEQEQDMFNKLILKGNTFVKNVAKKDLALCGANYDKDDERMIRVQGKGNAWMSVFFDTGHLGKSYDIRIQNSSALPQSKGARIQTVMELNKEFPGLLPQEQLVEILDLGQSDKFVSAVTVSLRAAEAENEALMEGKEVKEPEEYENLIIHWHCHIRLAQDWGFKYQTPQNIQQAVIDHIMATEYLMSQKAVTNPAFAQRLAALDGFPLFFKTADQVAAEEAAAVGAVPPPPVPGEPGAPPPELAPPQPINPDLPGAEPQDPTIPAEQGTLEQQLGLEPALGPVTQ